MAERPPFDDSYAPGLEDITTSWTVVQNPVQFAMRYAPAIRKYLEALVKNRHDAEELAQEFLLKGLMKGFVRTEQLRGKFRYYLKAAVRNAALTHLQRQQPGSDGPELDGLADPQVDSADAEKEWISEWRACVIDRALQALNHHQQKTPGNLFHTVVRLALDFPREDSVALAEIASKIVGRSISAEAFRKQLSRARIRFAELLVAEVTQTLEDSTPERVQEELAELGLLVHVRDYLP
jgi:RNA polymerase sigma-70 factor (ECF subfamily)